MAEPETELRTGAAGNSEDKGDDDYRTPGSAVVDDEGNGGPCAEQDKPVSSKADPRNESRRRSDDVGWQKVEDVCEKLKNNQFKSVVVVTGAGISTAAGVPDFRSDDGIYKRLEKLNLPEPESVFDISYFRNDPVPFYSLAQELSAFNYKPTFAHRLIKLLDDKGLLRRLYTQNIDGLDAATGLSSDRIIEAHGSFSTASCIDCGGSATEQAKEAIRQASVPYCTECEGLVKPDIVFFGESLPDKFYGNLTRDMESADLCLVIGTSLKVMPVASLPDTMAHSKHRVLINREVAGSIGSRSRDVLALGEIEDVVLEMAQLCGWLEELETMEIARD
ncbi:hypothetical protein NDN08_003736 [Rhodosorus marinus]|uniref:NAD-dependent protein deacetylase n=1 Tax=Rhodosorus marinus TaxID=101924 RepID=A0AAV8UYI6_9RHOD|nr:hypothetical protein NDN08_003736 [Rhodosorus marinus]